MNTVEFRKLCEVHSLPVRWLAQNVGRCSARNFYYYMHGRETQIVTVPDGVVDRMRKLNDAITSALG